MPLKNTWSGSPAWGMIPVFQTASLVNSGNGEAIFQHRSWIPCALLSAPPYSACTCTLLIRGSQVTLKDSFHSVAHDHCCSSSCHLDHPFGLFSLGWHSGTKECVPCTQNILLTTYAKQPSKSSFKHQMRKGYFQTSYLHTEHIPKPLMI